MYNSQCIIHNGPALIYRYKKTKELDSIPNHAL